MNISNARVLYPSGEIHTANIETELGLITAVGPKLGTGPALDLDGLLLLPGIVDLHGDGFERHIMPRPGVSFTRSLGLMDTDRTMTANGITTAYHGLTYSWEPGLRGREAALSFLEDFQRMRPMFGCDTKFHLRFETHNTPALDEIEGWMREGLVDMLAFNDHVESMFSHVHRDSKMTGYMHRTGLDRAQFMARLEDVARRKEEVPAGIERLAAVARELRIPMASHDDPDPETRSWFDSLGCTICEFPLNETTARAARSMGNPIVLGAPNALRGKSHDKRLMARHAIREGLCDALTSDYYYPSLLQAAFTLAREDVCDFPQAWDLVSRRPARAAGLDDRGSVAPGKRADFVVVDDSDPDLPRAVMTISSGCPVFSAGGLGLCAS